MWVCVGVHALMDMIGVVVSGVFPTKGVGVRVCVCGYEW